MPKLISRLPEPLLSAIDSWKFWVGVAYVGIAALMIWSVANTARLARDETRHEVERQLGADADYQRCLNSIGFLNSTREFVVGVNILSQALEQNSEATVEATPVTDPQYAVRIANLARLKDARMKVQALQTVHVPTIEECAKLKP